MPAPSSRWQQPRCDHCGRYGHYDERRDEYICDVCVTFYVDNNQNDASNEQEQEIAS